MDEKTTYTYTPEFVENASDEAIWAEFGELSAGKHFSDYASGDHSLSTTQLLRDELAMSGIPESLVDTTQKLNRFVYRTISSLMKISARE